MPRRSKGPLRRRPARAKQQPLALNLYTFTLPIHRKILKRLWEYYFNKGQMSYYNYSTRSAPPKLGVRTSARYQGCWITEIEVNKIVTKVAFTICPS